MDLPDFDDEPKNFNAVARFFHWVIAFLIVGMLALGLTMGTVHYGLPRHEVYDLHKSIGLLILVLVIARMAWRFASMRPEALATHALWERRLAGLAHAYLYIAMLAMPLTGWLMSDAGGRSPTLFGLPVPRLLDEDKGLRDLFGQAHYWLAMGLIVVIGLHVAGALKHHIIDRDSTLQRMAGERLEWFKTIFVILLIDLLLSLGAFLFLKDTVREIAPNAQGVAMSAPAALPDLSGLPAHGWMIDPRNSSLTFEAQVMGAAFTGHLNKFSGTVIFDPANLPMARADIVIDMNEIVSGDQSRDEMMRAAEWFAAEQWPESRYVTHAIEHMTGNQYVAIGDLTIRDVTMPLSIPFTLDITDAGEVKKAHMQALVTINRLDFQVGLGEWQGTESVRDAVRLHIDILALQPKGTP